MRSMVSDIQTEKERVKETINRLEKWLDKPDITESRTKALMGQLGKYREYLKLLEAGGAVPYIEQAEKEREKKTEKGKEN